MSGCWGMYGPKLTRDTVLRIGYCVSGWEVRLCWRTIDVFVDCFFEHLEVAEDWQRACSGL